MTGEEDLRPEQVNRIVAAAQAEDEALAALSASDDSEEARARLRSAIALTSAARRPATLAEIEEAEDVLAARRFQAMSAREMLIEHIRISKDWIPILRRRLWRFAWRPLAIIGMAYLLLTVIYVICKIIHALKGV